MGNTLYIEPELAVSTGTTPKALNHKGGVGALQIVVTGTVNFDLQATNSDIQAGESPVWLADSAANTGITASKWVTFISVPRFIRIYVNSITAGATIRLNYTQAND